MSIECDCGGTPYTGHLEHCPTWKDRKEARKRATAAASQAKPAQQDSRAEFEAWATSRDLSTRRNAENHCYFWHSVDECWRAWQAARSAPRPVLTDEQIDEIANDGMRNAEGGIYSTCVYRFAREIERAVTGGAKP